MPKRRKAAAKAPAPAPAAPVSVEPQQVRVKVVRAYVGSPPEGAVVEVTRTPYLDRLIRAGFMKVMR